MRTIHTHEHETEGTADELNQLKTYIVALIIVSASCFLFIFLFFITEQCNV